MEEVEIYNSENCFIVIQGPSVNVNDIKLTMKGKSFIFSTWEDEKFKYLKNDNVIFNTKPKNPGPRNLFYQQKSTLEGLIAAKRMGFKKVLKLRSDFIANDINLLLNVFNKKLNFFFWHDYNGGYFCDYLMSGDIDMMIELWKVDEKEIYQFPEELVLKNFLKHKFDIKNINFFLRNIDNKNDIYWTKYNKFLSSYKSEPLALDYIL